LAALTFDAAGEIRVAFDEVESPMTTVGLLAGSMLIALSMRTLLSPGSGNCPGSSAER